jgi:hypothetical protein
MQINKMTSEERELYYMAKSIYIHVNPEKQKITQSELVKHVFKFYINSKSILTKQGELE